MKRRPWPVFLFAIGAGALTGGWLGHRLAPPLEGQARRGVAILGEALETVKGHSPLPVETEELVEGAVRGLLRTLDPHSAYFSPSDYTQLQEEQSGRYFGLGILIRPVRPGSGRVLIVEPPARGGPGQRAGLRVGDVIARIDGEPTDDLSYPDDIVPRLRGPRGSRVTITVERPGLVRPMELTLERDEVPYNSIRYVFHLAPRVGYVRIERFLKTTGQELDLALEQLDEATLEGLVLDLRDNPGGALSQAIAVADRFLEQGQLIVSTRDRQGRSREYRAPRGRRFEDYPMVVLISERSASGSEIVAGALQDHDRAWILGQPSFGKALVQTVFSVAGSRGLALTTGKYYTPSNRLIQRDYSEGTLSYYSQHDDESGAAGAEYLTDSGRVVYGGGGIVPDEKVGEPGQGRLEQMLSGNKTLFFEFTADLRQRGLLPEGYRRLEASGGLSPGELDEVTERELATREVMARFREFLGKRFVFEESEFQQARPLIESRLKQEFLLTTLGDRESVRLSLEIDTEVQRALELMPEVRALLDSSAAG